MTFIVIFYTVNCLYFYKLSINHKWITTWEVSKYGFISGPYFPVFSPNIGKYGPEITPYFDTFGTVINGKIRINSYRTVKRTPGLFCRLKVQSLSKKTISFRQDKQMLKVLKEWHWQVKTVIVQSSFTCSKSTMETPEQCVNSV